MKIVVAFLLLCVSAVSANNRSFGTPKPCAYTDWKNLGGCVKGYQLQARKPKPVQRGCNSVVQFLKCQNCVVSAWKVSGTCSSGKKTSTRTVITPASGTGCSCPPLTKVCSCDDCVVTDWDTSGKCVNKKQTQTRTVITPATKKGTCVPLTQTVSCNDCEVGPWDTTGACDPITKKQTQLRQVTVPETNGGTCVPLTQEVPCSVETDAPTFAPTVETDAPTFAPTDATTSVPITPAGTQVCFSGSGLTTGGAFDQSTCPSNACISKIAVTTLNYNGKPVFSGLTATCTDFTNGNNNDLSIRGLLSDGSAPVSATVQSGTCFSGISGYVDVGGPYVSTLVTTEVLPQVLGYVAGEPPYNTATQPLGTIQCGPNSYLNAVFGRKGDILDALCFVCSEPLS